MKKYLILLILSISTFVYSQVEGTFHVSDSTAVFNKAKKVNTIVFDNQSSKYWQLTAPATATDSLQSATKKYISGSEPKIASLLTVSPDGTADYTTIQGAVNAASSGDVIEAYSGTYNENITMKNGVTLKGSSADAVIIQNSGVLLTLPSVSCDVSEVSFVLNAVSDSDIIISGSASGESTIRDCNFTVNASTAIKPKIFNLSSGVVNLIAQTMRYNHTYIGSNPGNTNLIHLTGTATLINIHTALIASFSQSDGVISIVKDDSQGVYLQTTGTEIVNVLNAGFSGTVSAYNSTTLGSSVTKDITNTQLTFTAAGSGTLNLFTVTGAGTTTLTVLAGEIKDTGFTTSTVANATGTNKIKYVFNDHSNDNFGSNTEYTYSNGTGLRTNQDFLDEGLMLIQSGVEPTQNTLQKIISQSINAGWGSGGAITDNTDGSVQIAAGTGFIRTSNSDTAPILSFDWAEDLSVPLVDDAENYVYVDYNAGSPQISVTTTSSTVLDNENDKFELFEVFRDGTALHITDHKQKSNNIGSLVQKYLYSKNKIERADAEGGLIIGEAGTRSVTVTAGKLLVKLNEILFSDFNSSGADTFTRVWADGIGGFNEVTGATQWDNAQYDNSGTLTNYGISKYGYLDLYSESDSDVSIVYGVAEFNSLAAAQLASRSPVPERLEDHALYTGRYFFQSGDPTGNPTSAFTTSIQGTATTDHGNLSGLPDDDHTQYLLLNGRSGGQIEYGGTDANDDLVLGSTSNATKGYVGIQTGDALLLGSTNKEAWWADITAMQIGGNSSIAGETTAGSSRDFHISQNAYQVSGDASRYQSIDYASQIHMVDGKIHLRTAPSGSSDDPITWVDAQTILANGNMGFGNIDPKSAFTLADAGSIFPLGLTTAQSLWFGRNIYTDDGGATFKRLVADNEVCASGFANDGSISFWFNIDANTAANSEITLDNKFTITKPGNVGIGTSAPSINADLTLAGGVLNLSETTTPTSDVNFGKIYAKSDNKLYFQDGAGSEHDLLSGAASGVSGAVQFSNGLGVHISDNANFHWDDTNNRLGIGTTTPDAQLQVVGEFAHTGYSGNNIIWNGSGWEYMQTGYGALFRQDGSGLFQLWTSDTGTGGAAATPSVRITVDNATGEVGINTISPNTILDVQGGQTVKVTTVSATTYNVLNTDYIIHSTIALSSTSTITLPTAQVVRGRLIKIKDASAFAAVRNIVIGTEGSNTIDGQTTFTIDVGYGATTLYCDGSNWFTL